jgi:hypothetical protein
MDEVEEDQESNYGRMFEKEFQWLGGSGTVPTREKEEEGAGARVS